MITTRLTTITTARNRTISSIPIHNLPLFIRYASSSSTTASSPPSSHTIPTSSGKKRLVVLGTGWGGYAFLKSLSYPALRQFDVKVVSPTTCFSFTPLLAQASCATLDFRSAIEPIHSNRWMEYHHAWCDALDLINNRIEVTSASNPQFRLSDPLSPSSSSSSSSSSTQAGTKRETYAIDFDYLVLSIGSYNATFGTKGVKENALFLKDVGDARAIRWRILGCFERANALHHLYTANGAKEMEEDQEREVKKLLSFVVVGGGPTGSEFAAELHDLIKEDLTRRLYPNLRPYPTIHLLDAGSTILSSFDASLSDYAMKKFSRDGISIRLNCKISSVEPDSVMLSSSSPMGEEKLDAGMVVWSTGITTSPLIEALQGVAKEKGNKSGKLVTGDCMNLLINKRAKVVGGSVLNPQHPYPQSYLETDAKNQYQQKEQESELVELPHVFAIGDCSTQLSGSLPSTAQVASQKGSYLAQLFNNHITPSLSSSSSSNNNSSLKSTGSFKERAKPFKFINKGSMASIGSNQALIDTPVKKESGALAWLLWRSAYTIMSMSWRNRFLVPANWTSNLIFGRDVGRF